LSRTANKNLGAGPSSSRREPGMPSISALFTSPPFPPGRLDGRKASTLKPLLKKLAVSIALVCGLVATVQAAPANATATASVVSAQVTSVAPAAAQAAPAGVVQAVSATQTVSASAVVRPSGVRLANNTWAKKTAAFAGCIFSVGIPIGAAIGIAWNPQVWAWVIGQARWPVTVGGTASAWLGYAKWACGYALF
jgi:hypothetical protein